MARVQRLHECKSFSEIDEFAVRGGVLYGLALPEQQL